MKIHALIHVFAQKMMSNLFWRCNLHARTHTMLARCQQDAVKNVKMGRLQLVRCHMFVVIFPCGAGDKKAANAFVLLLSIRYSLVTNLNKYGGHTMVILSIFLGDRWQFARFFNRFLQRAGLEYRCETWTTVSPIYHPVIKHSSRYLNGYLNGKIIYTWGSFHCHVWLYWLYQKLLKILMQGEK